MKNIIMCLLLFLLFFAVGMIIAVIVKPQIEFHGPNALLETQKIYYDSENDKCINFDIEPTACPKPIKKYQSIVNLFQKK